MKIWNEEAMKGRGNKQKTLVELLKQLDIGDHKEKKVTSKLIKDKTTVVGIQISKFITEFYALSTALDKSQKEIMRKIL